jgi:hypothetical protein
MRARDQSVRDMSGSWGREYFEADQELQLSKCILIEIIARANAGTMP